MNKHHKGLFFCISHVFITLILREKLEFQCAHGEKYKCKWPQFTHAFESGIVTTSLYNLK